VVRLRLFWVVFWIQAHGFESLKTKFHFPFSLFITCLFLFLFSNLADLVDV